MAIQKIEEVYLYYSDARGGAEENIGAVAFLERSGIPFTRMFYNAEANVVELFDALNTWWSQPNNTLPKLDKFPFVTYVEVHDDIPARHSPVKYAAGLEDIKKFSELYKSVNNV